MSQIFGRKRKKYSCESIDGRKLLLSIQNIEAPDTYCEFVLENVSCPSLKKMLCIIMFLSTCLILFFVCQIDFVITSVIVILLCHVVLKTLWTVKSETLLVVSPVGLQLNTTFLWGYEISHFIPWYCVSDVIINEAISLQRVLFYLAVLVEEEVEHDVKRKLIPLFQYTKPRLKALELMYVNVQRLFSEPGANASILSKKLK